MTGSYLGWPHPYSVERASVPLPSWNHSLCSFRVLPKGGRAWPPLLSLSQLSSCPCRLGRCPSSLQ